MIGKYTLKQLCDKYNVSSEKMVNKNNNILTYGEYIDIDNTLDYLINKLNISASNIERCPSILYKNVKAIVKNVDFLNKQEISFSSIEACLHVLSSEQNNLMEVYHYIEENYGVSVINKNTSVLSCSKELIIEVEKLNLNKSWNLTIASAVQFGATTFEEIQKIIQSKEYQAHPELFTSQTLAHAKLEEIQKIIQSKEYQAHPELFTSTTLAHATLEEIQKIIQSKEYQAHPELFTSTTLAHATLEEIQKIIQSKEYQAHPELFTSTTLAHAKLEEIQKIIQSKEYQAHPELFTSQTLAHATLEEIQKIIQSKEYQAHSELFTSTTLAHAKLEEIQKILQSKEYQAHPELFTSTTLAHAKLEDISKLLNMPYWDDDRFKGLLTSSIVAKSKQMIRKLPVLFSLAKKYQIEEYLNTSFLLFSPSQNFALINYLKENNLPLIIDDKLNPIFGKQPGVLKAKYGIDMKELLDKYHYEESNIRGGKNGIR